MTRPHRTCVACRRTQDKYALLRLVRQEDGTVVVDEQYQAPGRGAYVCRDRECIGRLAKGGRLSQAFRRPSKVEAARLAAVVSRDVHSITSSGR